MIRAPITVILILLLWVAGLLAGAQFGKIAVTITEFRAVYPSAGDGVAWLLTLVSILGAAFGVIAGLIAGFFGMRRVLLISLVIGAALSLWQSFQPSFTILALTRIVEGVSHLGLVITAPTLMAQIASDRWRGATMTLWSTFFGLSFAIVAWFGLPFITTFGLGPFLQIHAVLMVAVFVPLFLMLPKPDQTTATKLPSAHAVMVETWQAYRTPTILWPGVSWLFYTFTFLALLTILPTLLPVGDRSAAATLLSLTGMGVALCVLPILLRYMPATWVVIAAFLIAAVLLVATFAVPVLMRGVLVFSVIGFIQGGTFVAVSQINHSQASRALGFGIMAQTGNLGNLLGTPAMLALLAVFGTNGLLGVVAVIYVVAAALLILVQRKFPAKG